MARTGPFTGWMRNYEAMGDSKLLKCLNELRNNKGDAANRVAGRGGLMYEHIRECEAIAADKGLIDVDAIDRNATAKDMGVLTDPMECVECGKVERHYEDDYMCRTCRDAL